MNTNRTKSLELKRTSDTLFKSGHPIEASEILQQALDAAFCIIDDYEKSFALSEICPYLARQGQIARALAIALTIEFKDFKDFALSDICGILSEKGLHEEATRLLETIEDESIKEQALRKIDSKQTF